MTVGFMPVIAKGLPNSNHYTNRRVNLINYIHFNATRKKPSWECRHTCYLYGSDGHLFMFGVDAMTIDPIINES